MNQSEEKILKVTGLYFAPADYITEINIDGVEATVTFFSERTWEEIPFSESTFTEQEGDSDDGMFYKQSIMFTMAGEDETLQNSLQNLKSCKPVFMIEFDNGTSKLIGDLYNYCKVSYDFSSKAFQTGRDITVIRLSETQSMFYIESPSIS